MKRRLLKIFLPVVLGAAVVGGLIYYRLAGPKIEYEVEKIERGTIVQEVSVTGSIAPRAKVLLQPEVVGKVAAVRVQEGAAVKAGDVLIELDTRDIAAKIDGQRATLNSALARLKELEAGPTAEELALSERGVESAQSKLAAAIAAETQSRTALANARLSRTDTIAKTEAASTARTETLVGDMDDAVAAASDAINRLSKDLFTNLDQLAFSSSNPQAAGAAVNSRPAAKSALSVMAAAAAAARAGLNGGSNAVPDAQPIASGLATVKAHLDADLELLRYDSTLAAATVSAYQLNLNTALTAVNAASQALAASVSAVTVQQKTNNAELTAAATAVDNAEAAVVSAGFAVDAARKALAQAEADLALKKAGVRAETIAAQRATVDYQRAALEGLLAELGKRRLLAPLDGTVVDLPLELGETASPGTVVAAVSGLGKFEITTNISEIDIAKIEVGDPVRITLDAFPENEIWTGQVAMIQPAEKVVEGIIFYETTVVFDQEDARLRSGMTANLEIETDRRADVLRLPLRALKERRDGGRYVEVRSPDRPAGPPRQVDVTLGLENDEHVELLGGLREGEEVIVAVKTK